MKMKAILAVTLQLLLVLHTANYGFGQEESIPTCRAEMTTANNRICKELFEAFQAAIVTETNLYNLGKIFFPSSKEPPTLLNVKYKTHFETGVQIPCFNSSDTINSSEVWSKNYGWTSRTIYTVFHPATLNRMQPYLFYRMMAALESQTSASGTTEEALLWDGDSDFLTLNLVLDVKQLSCLPTNQQIDQTLQDITSLLKVYARDQKNLTELESQDSHVLDGRVFDRDWRKYECEIYSAMESCHVYLISNIFAFVLTIMAAIIILAVIKRKGPKKGNTVANAEEGITAPGGTNQAKGDKTYTFFHSLMWSAGSISLWVLLFFGFDVVLAFMWGLPWEGIILLSQLVVVMAFSVSSPWLLNHREKDPITHEETLQPVPILKPSRAFFTAVCFGQPLEYFICVCYRNFFKCIEEELDEKVKKLQKNNKAKLVAGFFPLGGLFLIAGYLSRILVPVTLYFLVYRLEVLTFYIFVGIAFLSTILVVTEFDFRRRCEKRERIEKKRTGPDRNSMDSEEDIAHEVSKEAHYCCHESFHWLEHHYPLFTPLFTLLLLAVMIMLYVLINHIILAQGQAGNALFKLFSLLIPAVALSVYSGYIGKRLRKHYRLNKKENSS